MQKVFFWVVGVVSAFAATWISALLGIITLTPDEAVIAVQGRGEECFRIEAIYGGNKYPHKFCFNLNEPNCGLTHKGLRSQDATFVHSMKCEEETVEAFVFINDEKVNPKPYWSINTFSIIRTDREELEGVWSDSNGLQGTITGVNVSTK